MKTVKKIWGKEVWIANCSEYCSKLLYLNKGATSSHHYHPIKKETFYVLEGQITLTIKDKEYELGHSSAPKTILPLTVHKFVGITDAIILETSTYHDNNDVIRLEDGKAAV